MKYRLLIFIIFLCSLIKAQNSEGFIIKLDGDKVYTNLHHPTIKVSDVLIVVSNGGTVAQIEIIAIPGAYSVGRVLGSASMPLAEKMTVRKDDNYQSVNSNVPTPTAESSPVPPVSYAPPIVESAPAPVQPVEMPIAVPQNNYSPPVSSNVPAQTETRTNFQADNQQQPVNNSGKVTVMIAPADVNFPQGVNNMVIGADGNTGYVGDYVITALEKQLSQCDKIELIDQTISQEIGIKAHYRVKVIMLKPDVAPEVSNNAPIGGLLGVIQGVTSNGGGKILQQMKQLAPENVNTKQVKVSVKMYVQIIDAQTGVKLFTSTSVTGKAAGTPQIGIDLPASVQSNKGIDINQGASFSQSVTGNAVEDAINQLGNELNNYFNNNF